MVVLAVLGFVALTQARADLLAFQGRAFVREGHRPPLPPDLWRDAQSRLERALELSPADPGIAEDLGRLHEARPRALQGGGAADLQRSLDYLRRSLRTRPTSPYTWANLAFVKSRIGALDAEFYQALENAARLGPWEPEVQLLLADIGFRYWHDMPKKARDTVHAALQRGLKRQDEKLFDLASRYRRLDVMCATPGVFRSRRALRCV